MSGHLEEKIDRLTRELEKHHSWLWLIARSLVGAVTSTIGVIFVLTVGVYVLRELDLVPGLNVLIDRILPAVEQYRTLRGF